MRVSDFYPSRYLKAEDFSGECVLTVKNVAVEELGPERERKPVLYFDGETRGLVLNKTNMAVLAKAYGDETEGWRGRPIALYPLEVQFKNEVVRALRVRIPAAPAPRSSPGRPVQSRPPASPPRAPARSRPDSSEPPTWDDSDAPRAGQDDDVPF